MNSAFDTIYNSAVYSKGHQNVNGMIIENNVVYKSWTDVGALYIPVHSLEPIATWSCVSQTTSQIMPTVSLPPDCISPRQNASGYDGSDPSKNRMSSMFSNNAVSGIEWAAYKSSGFDCSYVDSAKHYIRYEGNVPRSNSTGSPSCWYHLPSGWWRDSISSRDVSEHVTRAYLRSTLWIYFVFN